MNSLLLFLLCLPLLLAAGLVAAVAFGRRRPSTYGANVADGVHDESVSKLPDAAITVRHLLYRVGSSPNHVAVAGANDIPLGTIADEATDAQVTAGDHWLTVNLLGKGTTKRMVASEVMATTGVRVYAAAGGKIALSGNVLVGTLLSTSVGDNDIVEVQDCEPGVLSDFESVTATNVIAASESGRTFYLNAAAGFVSTLPAPVAGMRFTFIVGTAPTGGAYTVVTNGSANIIRGNANSVAGDAGDSGATDDTINFVANQSAAGDKVELHSDGTNWFAYAITRVAAGVTFTTAS